MISGAQASNKLFSAFIASEASKGERERKAPQAPFSVLSGAPSFIASEASKILSRAKRARERGKERRPSDREEEGREEEEKCEREGGVRERKRRNGREREG